MEQAGSLVDVTRVLMRHQDTIDKANVVEDLEDALESMANAKKQVETAKAAWDREKAKEAIKEAMEREEEEAEATKPGQSLFRRSATISEFLRKRPKKYKPKKDAYGKKIQKEWYCWRVMQWYIGHFMEHWATQLVISVIIVGNGVLLACQAD